MLQWQTTKSKIRNQLQSPAFRGLATPQASSLVLSTSNMRGVGYPKGFQWFLSCDLLKKTPDPLFGSAKSSLFLSCSLYLSRMTHRAVPLALGSTAQRRTVDAGRVALFPAYRQVSSPLVSPAFSRSAVQRCHKLNPTSQRGKQSQKCYRDGEACVGTRKSPVLFKTKFDRIPRTPCATAPGSICDANAAALSPCQLNTPLYEEPAACEILYARARVSFCICGAQLPVPSLNSPQKVSEFVLKK